jgi:hypothetical protein
VLIPRPAKRSLHRYRQAATTCQRLNDAKQNKHGAACSQTAIGRRRMDGDENNS